MIKAIPQEFEGIRYRSRTEARWAHFLSMTNTAFIYEPEGYRLGSDWYVPDFYLPNGMVHLEVKPGEPNEREVRVAKALAQTSRTPVIIAMGNPSQHVDMIWFDATGESDPCVFLSEHRGSGVWAAGRKDASTWLVPLGANLKNCSGAGDVHPMLDEASRLQFENRPALRSASDVIDEVTDGMQKLLKSALARLTGVDRKRDSA